MPVNKTNIPDHFRLFGEINEKEYWVLCTNCIGEFSLKELGMASMNDKLYCFCPYCGNSTFVKSTDEFIQEHLEIAEKGPDEVSAYPPHHLILKFPEEYYIREHAKLMSKVQCPHVIQSNAYSCPMYPEGYCPFIAKPCPPERSHDFENCQKHQDLMKKLIEDGRVLKKLMHDADNSCSTCYYINLTRDYCDVFCQHVKDPEYHICNAWRAR